MQARPARPHTKPHYSSKALALATPVEGGVDSPAARETSAGPRTGAACVPSASDADGEAVEQSESWGPSGPSGAGFLASKSMLWITNSGLPGPAPCSPPAGRGHRTAVWLTLVLRTEQGTGVDPGMLMCTCNQKLTQNRKRPLRGSNSRPHPYWGCATTTELRSQLLSRTGGGGSRKYPSQAEFDCNDRSQDLGQS